MQRRRGSAHTALGALVVTMFLAGPATGQDYGAPPAVCSMEQLAGLSRCELQALYRRSPVGAIPAGYAPGRPLYDPESALAGVRGKAAGFLWRGKHFCPDGILINQWRGVRAIRAEVGHGVSWLDGGPAIVMDYRSTSWVWSNVRDEMREVAPGLFLGLMYRCRGPQPRFKMFFALDTRCGQCRPLCASEVFQ
jgi:hypothetical protein